MTVFLQYFVTCFFFFTAACSLYGQHLSEFKHFTTRNGLTKNYIKSILQDQKGFLWIGTNDGLNRYDGYTFTAYRNKPGEAHTLSNNEINVILEDSQHQLWIGTNGGGLNRYLPDEDGFISYTTENSQLNNNLIFSLLEDKNGIIWIGTHEGLSYFDKESDTFSGFGESEFTQTIHTIFEDSQGRIWAGTNAGLGLVDQQKRQIIFPLTGSFNPHNISSIVEDAQGRLWVGTLFHGIMVLEIPADKHSLHLVKRFTHNSHHPGSLSSNLILTLFKDHLNHIWVGTDLGGLNKYDVERDTFIRFKNDARIESSISSNNILAIEEDHLSNLWIGTNFGGLNYLDRNRAFDYIKSNPYHHASSPVLSIYVDERQHTWIGTDGNGLSCISPTGEFTQYVHKNSGQNSIGGNTIQKIYEDKQGNLWLGTYNHGLSILQKNGIFKHFKSDDGSGLSNDDIRAILSDTRGNLWIGTNGGGLNLYHKRNEQFTAFKTNLDDQHSLSSDSVVCLYEDSRGLVWVGTVHGSVCFFDPGLISDDKITFYQIDLPVEDSEKLYGNSVISITEDIYGNMWFGNYVSGLTKMEFNTRRLIQYNEADGLPGNTINGLLSYKDGSVWISTNQGLAQYAHQIDSFHVYDELDGLQGNDFLHGAFFKYKDNKLYFGGINGINTFYPDSIKKNEYIPKIVIKGVKVFDKHVAYHQQNSTSKKQVNEAREIILDYDQSTFTFEFVALSYPFAEKNQYAVMLEGFEDHWRYIDTDRSATYTNIHPGNYVFRVKGSNNDGVWNEQGAFIKVRILSPWWRTGWAYLVYIILLGGILYVAVTLTVKRIQLNERLNLVEKEKEYEHLAHQSKIEFFTNISHEFRTPLTLILNPLEKIIREEKDPFKNQHDLMYRNAQWLLRLVDQLLDFRKVTTGSLQLKVKQIDLVEFVGKMYELFRELSTQQHINFHFNTAVPQLHAYIDIDKIEKVIYNLLSNAFKFTPEYGEIMIRVSVKEEAEVIKLAKYMKLPDALLCGFVEIEIADNGRGISAEELEKIFSRFYQAENNGQVAHSGTGIGLALAKELVELHHGLIQVESKLDIGSSFRVWLPLGKSCFEQNEVVETIGADTLDAFISHEVVKLGASPPSGEKDNEVHQNLPRILIVDDNVDIRLLLKENLGHAYQIEEAGESKEAIRIAKEKQPELIVSDVMMPEMDGFELCEKLKNDIDTSHIPLILLTARTTLDQRMKGIDTGADAYITKPFSLGFLEIRIRKLIENRKKLRDHFLKNELLTPRELAVTSLDEVFLQKVKNVLEQYVADASFKIETFCKEVGMSNTQLYTKVKGLTGFSPNELIKDFRLKRAVQLLGESDYTVNEIALAVGFNDAKYFARCFRKQFGKTPSDFMHEHRVKT